MDSDVEILSGGSTAGSDTAQVTDDRKGFNKRGGMLQSQYPILNISIPGPSLNQHSIMDDSVAVMKFPGINKEISARNTKETSSSTLTVVERSAELPFKCTICDLHFVFEAALKAHKRKHASQGVIEKECSIAKTNVEQSLNTPDMLNKDLPKFKCDICSKEFQLSSELDIHEDSHTLQALKTGVEPRVAVKCQNNNSFICLECDDVFKTRRALELHGLECSRYTCVYCDEKFSRKMALFSHELEHPGAKDSKCILCGQQLTSRKSWRSHTHSHFVDGTTTCEKCDKSFESVSNLKCHINSDHKDEQLGYSNRQPTAKEVMRDYHAMKRKLPAPLSSGYQLEGSNSLLDGVNTIPQMITHSEGVRCPKLYTPAQLAPATHGPQMLEDTSNARMSKLPANWFYPPGWKKEPLKLPLNQSSSSVGRVNNSLTNDQIRRNGLFSVLRPAVRRPLPKILSVPPIIDSTQGSPGKILNRPRKNLIHAPRRTVLPIKKNANIPAIRTQEPKNLLEALEQCGSDSMSFFHQPRTMLPVKQITNVPVVGAYAPKNLLDVFDLCAADSPTSFQRKVLPVKQLSNMPAIPALQQMEEVDTLNQGSADPLVFSGRSRRRRFPQILPPERSVALAARAEMKPKNVNQSTQGLSADMSQPSVAETKQLVARILCTSIPDSSQPISSDGGQLDTNDYPPVAQPSKISKRYYVRHPKQDIVYDVDSMYYVVRKYSKLEHSFLVVVWSENFDLDLATSIAFNASDCFVCVRQRSPSTVDNIDYSDDTPSSLITIGPSVELQYSFHCFTYGGYSLSEAVTDDHQCDSFEIFEARLAKYAAAQGRTVLNLFTFSQYERGWCKIISGQLREKIVVGKRM